MYCIRSLSQTPAEHIDETMLKGCMFKFYGCVTFKNKKKRFPLEEVFVATLEILNSVAAQDRTTDPSLLANVALHIPHLVPEGQLEATSIVVSWALVQ